MADKKIQVDFEVNVNDTGIKNIEETADKADKSVDGLVSELNEIKSAVKAINTKKISLTDKNSAADIKSMAADVEALSARLKELNGKALSQGAGAELTKNIDTGIKYLDKLYRELGARFKVAQSKAKAMNDELSRKYDTPVPEYLMQTIPTALNNLDVSLRNVKAGIKSATENYDVSALNALLVQLQGVKSEADRVSEAITFQNGGRKYGGELNDLRESIASVERDIETKIPKAMKKSLETTKSEIERIGKTIGDVLGSGFNAAFKVGKKSATVYFSFLRKGFSSAIGFFENKFKGLFKGADLGSRSLLSQLMPVVGVAGLSTLIKKSTDLTSSLFEVQNVVDNVFDSASDDINFFCENAVDKFGITELAAKQMIGIFGGILNASGITEKASREMSKNLVALTGDLASFYNMSEQDVYKKLQSGLTGNVQAMRSFGVVMTEANLNAYALSRGISTSYKEMSQAEKTTLRYNFILNQLSNTQGDFARTSGSWANQIRLLSLNFQQLGSVLGGIAIKVLYPVVRGLNTIVVAATKAAQALAKLFGFDASSLAEQFGGSGGMEMPELDDTTSGMEDLASATDDAAKAQEKYNEQLQGFDRINNVNESASKASSGLNNAGISGVGSLDFDSYYEDILTGEKASSKLEEWLNSLLDLMTDGRWYEAGTMVGGAIADVVDSVYDNVVGREPEVKRGIVNFNKALAEFVDGGLTEIESRDTLRKTGNVLGTLTNYITTFIDEFYTSFHDRDMFKRAGAQVAEFFQGIQDSLDWNKLGKSMTTGFRISMEMLNGFIENYDFDRLGGNTKELLLGALERAFGDGGAETIGKNISGVFTGGLHWFISTFGDTKVVGEFTKYIAKMLNTAISDISPEDVGAALSTIFDNIGIALENLSDTNFDELGTKLGEGVNISIDNGSVNRAVRGFTNLFLGIVKGVTAFARTVDWYELVSAVWEGLKEGFASDPTASADFAKILAFVFVTAAGKSVLTLALKGVGKGVVDLIAKGIAGGASEGGALSTALKGVGSKILSLFSVKGLVVTGALAGVSYLTYQASKAFFEFEKNVQSFEDTLKVAEGTSRARAEAMAAGIEVLFKGDSAIQFASNLTQVRMAFDSMSEGAKTALETGSDFLHLNYDSVVTSMSEIADAFEKHTQGYDKEIARIRELAGQENLTYGERKNNYKEFVELYRQLAGAFYSNQVAFLDMTEDEYEAFDTYLKSQVKETTDEVVDNLKTFTKDANNVLDSAGKNAGGILGKNIKSSFNANNPIPDITTKLNGLTTNVVETLSSKGTLAGENLGRNTQTGFERYDPTQKITTVSANLGEKVDSSLSNAGLNAGQHMSSNIATNAERFSPQRAVDGVINNTVSSLLNISKVGGTNSGSSMMQSLVSAVTGYNITSPLNNKVTSSVNAAKTNTVSSGKNAGVWIVDGITAGLGSASFGSALSSRVTSSVDYSKSSAKSGGRSVGENIISGVKDGVSGSSQNGVFSSLRNFADNMVWTLKNRLGIASPSKVFESEAEWIPEGVALGVEKNARVAYDAVRDFSEGMEQNFNAAQFDMSDVVTPGKFDGFFDSLLESEDMFIEDFNRKLEELGRSGFREIQVIPKMEQLPKLKAQSYSMQAQSEQISSASSITSDMMSMLSQLGRNSGTMKVDVYLDARNKLGQFVIDTVNGRVIQTGGF